MTQVLALRGNVIGAAGATSFAEALTVKTTLNISSSPIGNARAASLAEALRDNAALTSLKLGGNSIRSRLRKQSGSTRL
jgi:hypothetical protein